MLNTQDLVNYISQSLNTIGAAQTETYSFRIVSDIGETKGGTGINGIIRPYENTVLPVNNGYIEAMYTFVCDLIIPASRANYHVANVNQIVGLLIAQTQKANVQLSDGECIITLTAGVPKKYDVHYGYGESVVLSFTIHVTYTQNAVTSADKHWSLDGTPIPFLRESVSIERDGYVRKIFTEPYSRILLTGETKYYTFTIPYQSTVYASLQQEILQSAWQTHTLTYYDGVSFTQENPFTQEVVIFRTGNSHSESPNGSVFEITFSDKYNASGKTLQYYMALIDFPFDSNGEDTRYFASQTEQQQYFESKASASTAPFILIDAPNLDNLMITKQVYNSTGAAGSQFDYASKNYAIIKVVSSSATNYFYYFIDNCMIGANGQVVVDLKMDTIQTYFFDPSVTFSDCMIERAHLNRFVDNGNGTVSFVSDPATKIFNAEEGMKFPKRILKRTKLNLQFTGNEQIDQWLNENIAYWVYVFIAPNHAYNVGNIGTAGSTVTSDTININGSTVLTETKYVDGRIFYGDGLSSEPYCISYPIYSTKNKIIVQTSVKNGSSWDEIYININNDGRIGFENLNQDTSFFYNIKISMIPPFQRVSQGNVSMSIQDGNLIIPARALTIENIGSGYVYTDGNKIARLFLSQDSILSSATGYGRPCVVSTDIFGETYPDGVFFGVQQSSQALQAFAFDLQENNQIAKNAITTQQPPNPSYNPKLNGQNFKEIVITASDGESFTYDIQKLAEPSVIFEYSEPVVPEITRYYMRAMGGTGLYTSPTDQNYMGLVGSTDNSLAFTNNQYAAYIANNKNFFLQSGIKMGANLISGVAGGAASMLTGDVAGGASAIAGSMIGTVLSAVNLSLTVDNMKNAPEQMKNANGNIIFNLFTMDLGLYVEEYSALDGDLETANDFMDLYGFTFSSVGNIRDYSNIRKYHNYIKAQLQSVDGNLSNVARRDLRDRFSNGVRFWNSDTVSYQYENYENWLDEETAPN